MDVFAVMGFVGKIVLGLCAGVIFMIIAGFVSATFGDGFCKTYHPKGDSWLKRSILIFLILVFVGLSIASFPYSLVWANAGKVVFWIGVVLSVIIFGLLNFVSCVFIASSAANPDHVFDDYDYNYHYNF